VRARAADVGQDRSDGLIADGEQADDDTGNWRWSL
jgi:hypothetical protein